MAEVSLRNVCKNFGSVQAVKDVTLDIRDREFLVLVGPSGCGKSTTLRMVAGLEDITSGDIRIGDRIVNDVAPKDRDVAMVFQNYALYPHMNVYENMAFGLKLRKFNRGEIDRRVREAADILGIGDLLHRKPKELSGGQRQRVALGRAIVREPAVFLMDEPLSNLDAKLRVQTRTELAKLHARLQTTVIYVTHDQTEAMTLGDRIVVMKDGIVHQVAPPQELYERPANMFVASFIGSPAMNFLRGRLERDGDGARFVAGSVAIPFSADQVQRIPAPSGATVVLGVRPEHIEAGNVSDEAAAVEAMIEVVEPLGSETYLYLKTGTGPEAHSLTVRANPDQIYRDGDRIRVAFQSDKLHLFDATSETAYF